MKPILLCILDGVGIRQESYGNAFLNATKPTFDYLWNKYPHSLLEASGKAVGLPSGQMGNSEVGHLNIGSGRVVYQPLEMISKSINDKTFFNNEKLLSAINHTKENNSKMHLLGLLSDGGVHSTYEHLFALIDMCKQNNLDKVYIHVFTDGRDTLKRSAKKYLDLLNEKIKGTNYKIATISGRYYAMDRDNNWDRIKKAYNAITKAEGEEYLNYNEVLEHNYAGGIDDEFIIPAVLDVDGIITDNDALITFNFRPDRLRELFGALTNKENNEFPRKQLENLKLITMMSVSEEVIYDQAFDNQILKDTFGEYISNLGLKQLRIAETEKYAHVTYFFDGGIEKKLANTKRILIPSPKVATYDLAPGMSALEITSTLIKELDNDYDYIILNYANGDMVGHTGNYNAAIKAIEALDICLKQLYKKIKELDGIMVITADHGNCDYMIDDKNNVITAHSTSKVPFIITDESLELIDGKLSDIAPTILELNNIKVPDSMTGTSLIRK